MERLHALRASIPDLDHVLLVDGQPTNVAGARDYHTPMAEADERFGTELTDPEGVALLHFTSGISRPEGAIHVHEAVVAHHITGKLTLDLHRDDMLSSSLHAQTP